MPIVSTDEERQAEPGLADVQRRKRRRDGRHAGRDADRHGQRVVDQQRRGSGQAGDRTEIVARDDVGAAAAGEREDRLPKRKRDRDQQDRDQDRDRLRLGHRRQAADHQDAQDLLGRVGDRRQRVRREDREPAEDSELVMASLIGRDRAADDHPLQRGEHAT